MPNPVGLSQVAAVGLALQPVSAANTAAATSNFVDLQGLEGVAGFLVMVGAVTGTLVLSANDSPDGTTGILGTTVPANLGAVLSNTSTWVYFDVRSVRRFIQLVGTIVTGPSIVGYQLLGYKKYRP